MLSLLQELNSVNTLQTDLRNAGDTDAGATDVSDKASAQNDVRFSALRNTINSDGEVTGKDISDYIARAEDLNDEIDTITFGIETDDNQVIKVYVNAEQAEGFEEALSNLLGLEEDLEDALNRLAGEYDIVDIVWPTVDGGEQSEVEQELEDSGENDEQIAAALDTNDQDDDNSNNNDDDDFEVVAAIPTAGDTEQPTSDDGVDGTTDDLQTSDLPDLPAEDNAEAEATTWQLVNDAVVAKYPEGDVTGVADLELEALGEVIDLEKADEIAISQYDAADFIGLDADEKEDIINANPEIVLIDIGDKEPEGDTGEGDTKEKESDKPEEPKEKEPKEKEPKEPKEKEPKSDIPESKSFSFLHSLTQNTK